MLGPGPGSESAWEMALVNDLRELPRVAGAVDEFCTSHELGTQLSYAIDLAFDEVLSYCIAHAYDDSETHPIEAAVYLDPEEIVLLVVTDGVDLAAARQSLLASSEATLDPEGIEELGLFLVHQVMDTVTHERTRGCNVVVMTKRRPQDVAQEAEPD